MMPARCETTLAAAPSSSCSIFGEPTPEQGDALAEATRKRFEAYAKGGD